MDTDNEDLKKIRVLWRQPDTLTLWGVPYELREGQSPRDLWGAREEVFASLARRPSHFAVGSVRVSLGWIYLGSPGWWGTLGQERQETIAAFLRGVSEHVPGGPGEWSRLP